MGERHTIAELRQWQSLPLEVKVSMSCARIRAWISEFGQDGTYISFSGGKDSTVLVDLVRNKCGYEDVRAMFVDVPTQYPELKDFVKTYDKVDIVKPKISFKEVCEKYGFPLISKDAANCIGCAKRYLTKINNKNTILQTDRQTDRSEDYIQVRKLYGVGEFAKKRSQDTWDADQEGGSKGEYP